jgi:PAS domain S-box-containing protein
MTERLPRSLYGQLLGLWGLIALLLTVLALLTFRTLDTVKIHGPLYEQMIQAKDVVADVLPPPEYLVEAFLVTLQAVEQSDETLLNDLVRRLQDLRAEYEHRHGHWAKTLPDGPVREWLVNQSYERGLAFWTTVDYRLIPALQKRERAAARRVVAERLTPQYEAHRAAIDEVVRLAQAASADVERRAIALLTTNRVWLQGLFAAVIVSTVLLGLVTSGLLARRARALAASLEKEREAKEQAAELARAVEQTEDAVLLTDRQGVIEYVNPAFTTITGYAPEEAKGRTPGELLKSGRQDRAFYQMVWETILTGETYRGTLTNRKRSGELYVTDETISAIRNAAGGITHFVAVQRDITERRRLEAQLQQSQKLEAIGQLAGGIAHDFNNLLTPILGHAELLLRKLSSSERLVRNVGEIQRAGRRAASLTRQLLTFSRRQMVEPQILDLNRVLAEVASLLRRTIGEGIELSVIPGEPLGTVKADPSHIETVILNLAINARDAMPDGGRLTLETQNVDLDAAYVASHMGATPGPYLRLAVSDSGQGIPPDILARIFEPFFTTKNDQKGTGLGLTMVDQVVKQAGGFVEVYSEVGRGTTFKVYLPRADRETAPSTDTASNVMSLRGVETILFVEDEEQVRDVATPALQDLGYTVLEAADGEAALRIADGQAGTIHLLLTDVVLPKMNGSQLAQALLKRRPGIKVLFVSGYTASVIKSLDVNVEGLAFLPKPYTPNSLAQRVRRLLDRPLPVDNHRRS